MGDSLSGLVDHDDHRMRRSVYNPHFSPKSIRKLEPIIWEMVSRLLVTFQQYKTQKKVIPMKLAFGALSCDIITQYCFGVDEKYTETPDFKNVVLESIEWVLPAIHFFAYFPWILYFLFCLPDGAVSMVAGSLLEKLKELKHVSLSAMFPTIELQLIYLMISIVLRNLLISSPLKIMKLRSLSNILSSVEFPLFREFLKQGSLT